jgi:uncharacterized membrane protein
MVALRLKQHRVYLFLNLVVLHGSLPSALLIFNWGLHGVCRSHLSRVRTCLAFACEAEMVWSIFLLVFGLRQHPIFSRVDMVCSYLSWYFLSLANREHLIFFIISFLGIRLLVVKYITSLQAVCTRLILHSFPVCVHHHGNWHFTTFAHFENTKAYVNSLATIGRILKCRNRARNSENLKNLVTLKISIGISSSIHIFQRRKFCSKSLLRFP